LTTVVRHPLLYLLIWLSLVVYRLTYLDNYWYCVKLTTTVRPASAGLGRRMFFDITVRPPRRAGPAGAVPVLTDRIRARNAVVTAGVSPAVAGGILPLARQSGPFIPRSQRPSAPHYGKRRRASDWVRRALASEAMADQVFARLARSKSKQAEASRGKQKLATDLRARGV